MRPSVITVSKAPALVFIVSAVHDREPRACFVSFLTSCRLLSKAFRFVGNTSLHRFLLLALFSSLSSPPQRKQSSSLSLYASWAQEVFHLLKLCLFTFNSMLLTFECPSRTGILSSRGNCREEVTKQPLPPLLQSLVPWDSKDLVMSSGTPWSLCVLLASRDVLPSLVMSS